MQALGPVAPPTLVFVTVDTEEDNWIPARSDVTVENVRELPRLQTFFDRLGIVPTYLTSYHVVTRPWAADLLRHMQQTSGAEVGAHLHPWNTPPFLEKLDARSTMLGNLPYELQLTKLRSLTDALESALGGSPVSFRTGRYGLGPDTIRALLCCGYRVDSSVTPFMNWKKTGDGPDFQNAPLECHLLQGQRATLGADAGSLLEVPLSVGYSRRPFNLWDRVHSVLATHSSGMIPTLALARRLGFPKKIVISPELSSAADMLSLARELLRHGLRHLQLFLHSPTLRPGLTPYVTSFGDADRLFGRIEDFVEGLGKLTSVRFATLSEAWSLCGLQSAGLSTGDRSLPNS